MPSELGGGLTILLNKGMMEWLFYMDKSPYSNKGADTGHRGKELINIIVLALEGRGSLWIRAR